MQQTEISQTEIFEKLCWRQKKLIYLWVSNFFVTAFLAVLLVITIIYTNLGDEKFSPFSLQYLKGETAKFVTVFLITSFIFAAINISIFVLQIMAFLSLKKLKPLVADFSINSEIDFLMKMMIAFLILDFLSIFFGLTSPFLFLLLFSLKIFYWFRWKRLAKRF